MLSSNVGQVYATAKLFGGDERVQAKLTFLGAAQNVTGSRYVLDVDGVRLLIDCGLYQEREYQGRNWDPFPVPPRSIDAILLTHAHIDHCGLLPKLVKDGFRGKVYATGATAEITKVMLMDSAHIQEEAAETKRRRHEREGRRGPHPEVPLYTTEDAAYAISRFLPVGYEKPVDVGGGVQASFHDAGHILGSAMIRLRFTSQGSPRTIIFSGDIGRWNKPILRDPTLFSEADYLLIESTYGDRLHEPEAQINTRLTGYVNSTHAAGGNLVIPAFALGRAQELLYRINSLQTSGRIPHFMVFVDSPLATSVVEIYERNPGLFDREMAAFMRRGESPFDFPNLKMIRTVEESKAINRIKGTAIIIASSGMADAGRIKHHLIANLPRMESTVLFVGYQAHGTLGRQIVDGMNPVRILGEMHSVRAHIGQLNGLSAHADRDELLRWLSAFQKPPQRLFITHGETTAAHSFARYVMERLGWSVRVPGYRDEAALD